ncbi:MAG: glycosyltransferase family 2 protein [Pyrinomonadaceae bacterium]|nr:glycosyltransferase family 2 protein [Pyrinomonadaceae bacterium]MCX7639428.1 glycosyltransferase family 2 protein [Pyrinomonadaceae bacterium]MDW8304522.1 glycosyltransferase family 2 protein [Acidobacteriota bacterium]
MKVSIALCTYNGEKFLLEQLDSFLNQTRLPDELIVCDDASTDSTLEIIEKFSSRAPFEVRLYRNERNLGSHLNFEKAIGLCRGDIIFLSDQDDIWNPTKIEIIESKFTSSRSLGMVFTDAELIDEASKPLNKRLWDFYFPRKKQKDARKNGILSVLLRGNVVTGATMAFRAELKKFLLPFPQNLPNLIHDGWIALCASLLADVCFLEKPLIKYRIHEGQQIGIGFSNSNNSNHKVAFSKAIEFLEKDIERLQILTDVLKEYPKLKEFCGKIDAALVPLVERNRENILHLKNRMNLPDERVKRIAPIFIEFLSGRYNKFSKGVLSAAKDFFR